MLYVSQKDDVVDAICYRFYGNGSATVTVLDANPNVGGKSLAEWGPLLPAGLEIELPELITEEPVQGVQLWD